MCKGVPPLDTISLQYEKAWSFHPNILESKWEDYKHILHPDRRKTPTMDCHSLVLEDLVGELGIWAKSWQGHLFSYRWKKEKSISKQKEKHAAERPRAWNRMMNHPVGWDISNNNVQMKTKAGSSRIPFLKYFHTIFKNLNFILKMGVTIKDEFCLVWPEEWYNNVCVWGKKSTVKNLRTGCWQPSS